MKGARPLVFAVIDRLKLNWAEAAAAAQAEAGLNDVRIREPEGYHHFLSDTEEAYPQVFVIPGSARAEEQTGNWITRLQEIVVILEDRRDESSHLADALLLGEAAIIHALAGPSQPPAPAYSLVWRTTEPGPLFQLVRNPDSRMWQSYIEMSFDLRLLEEETTL